MVNFKNVLVYGDADSGKSAIVVALASRGDSSKTYSGNQDSHEPAKSETQESPVAAETPTVSQEKIADEAELLVRKSNGENQVIRSSSVKSESESEVPTTPPQSPTEQEKPLSSESVEPKNDQANQEKQAVEEQNSENKTDADEPSLPAETAKPENKKVSTLTRLAKLSTKKSKNVERSLIDLENQKSQQLWASTFGSDSTLTKANYEKDEYKVETFFWDVSNVEKMKEWDSESPFIFSNLDVIILCYSADKPDYFNNLAALWKKEFKKFNSKVSTILVANKIELRTNEETIQNLKKDNKEPVSQESGKKLAKKVLANAYIELQDGNVDELFNKLINEFVTIDADNAKKALEKCTIS